MRRFAAPLFALALIVLAFALRWPHLGREIWNVDEGVTFTMGQQVLAGEVLYRDAADHRSPLLPYVNAAIFAVAGDWNAHAVHLAFALAMAGTAMLLWRLARRLGDEPAGVAAAVVFTVVSFVYLDPGDALAASTGWAVAFFSTAGYALFAWSLTVCRNGGRRSVAAGADGAAPSNQGEQRASSFVRGLVSGLCFGASIACKQPGALDLAAAMIVLGVAFLRAPREARRSLVSVGAGLAVGGALPMILFAAYFGAKGAYDDFVYYAFTYNTKTYIPEVALLARWRAMAEPFKLAWGHVPEVLLLGGVAAILGVLALFPRSSAARRSPLLPWVFLGWTAAGIVSTGLSGRTFSHYSAQVAPGLSLACGWMVSRLFSVARDRTRRLVLRGATSGLLLLVSVGLVRDCIRRGREIDSKDGSSRAVGQLISAHSAKTERIFAWGYTPELYQFAHRLPASRFIYANFVTGMIPWTNLDALVDTGYAVIPHAWEQLADDLQRHPPALIVDTGGRLGYLKYPLHEQPLLREMVERDFAEVAVGDIALGDMHLYRRLESPPTAALDRSLPSNSSIELSGLTVPRRNQHPRVLVAMPAGAQRVELYAGSHPIAAVSQPTGQRVSVAFSVDPRRADAHELRAVITTSTGRSVSAAFDFSDYAGRMETTPPAGPPLQLNELPFPPLAEDRTVGEIRPSPLYPNTWRLDAPVTLEYPCPANLAWLSFLHGPYPETQGKSDGYDLQVSFQDLSGKSSVLHQHRMLPRTVGKDQRAQPVRLQLPPHPEGRLIFRFLAGEHNDPNYDWIYFGQLLASGSGPMLLLGDRPVLPSSAIDAGDKPMQQQLNGTWIAHAPARVEWARPTQLLALTLNYGMEDGAYSAADGHSDGVEFALDLVETDGRSRRLFHRELTPFNHPEHRGPQTSRIEIPANVPGKLVLTVGPGPRGDQSWDWAYIGKIFCEGPGPNLVISEQRELMPISSRTVDASGAPSKYDGDHRWGAHADAELVYERPADLTRVTFHYGLAESAARDDNGQRRSDGVDAVVEFAAEGEPARELFRRHLDPFAHPEDAGTQTSTVELPRYRAGRLIFRLTPGPSGNNAFDWGYWGVFRGEVTK